MDPITSLTRALVEPAILTTLRLGDWDTLIRYARPAGVLARLHALLEVEDLLGKIPIQIVPHLAAAGIVADHERRILDWEVNRIERALGAIDGRLVLLKGAAYTALGLGVSRGRISSDIDILVPKDSMVSVEKTLLDHGWEHIKLDEYDQYFYRIWSHELPPLQHRDRGTIVDVHHAILPPTGRLHPDPEKLISAAVQLEGTRFCVLAPADLVLHSAAHAFQDGDFTRGLRDIVDLDDLLRHFSQKENFWDELLTRAEELDLCRPLYYALRYSNRYLQTPVPQNIIDRSNSWQPAWPACAIMDAMVDDMITSGPWRKDFRLKLSRQLLYMRSHWLRMPPYLLFPHLIRKTLRKRRARAVG